jgi:hypothetical protein
MEFGCPVIAAQSSRDPKFPGIRRLGVAAF